MPFWRNERVTPAQIIITGFLLLILSGTLLLMLPFATREPGSASFVDALFTATSATCVTGLILHDTVQYWTPFGQAVILLLIQVGGMGVVTMAVAIFMFSGKKIGLKQRWVMQESIAAPQVGGIVRMTGFILKTALAIEGVGAVLLAIRFCPQMGFFKGLWYAVFHSVSAFCNAGFDLLGGYSGAFSSLAGFNDDPVVLLTTAALITVGGLGFFVWEDVLQHRRWKKLSLYSRLVLSLTAALILFGALFFFAVEYRNPATLGPMPLWQKGLNALFQSVTLRTAGFDALGQGGLTDSSLALSVIFMLIGGSSGSTAGGLKTVTVAVLLLAFRAGVRGREEVTLRGRAISHRRVMNAMTLTLMVVFLFMVSSMLLSTVDGLPFLSAAFEVASAMGTVGLTVGITPGLSLFSRGVLVFLMYVGRVGILSFSIAFLTRSKYPAKIKYPTFDIMIG